MSPAPFRHEIPEALRPTTLSYIDLYKCRLYPHRERLPRRK